MIHRRRVLVRTEEADGSDCHTQCPFSRGLCCDRPMAPARWRRPTLTYVWNGTNGIGAVLPTTFSLYHLRSTDTQRHFSL
ncbi:hypothetical protein J4Q44_G00222590 [Coregonus suidteri]|uniref:Uncharacterized protein n=1 Tax=Coregonus suidteri TaxID=861788 RepID=A0AAN8LSC2_9TELE